MATSMCDKCENTCKIWVLGSGGVVDCKKFKALPRPKKGET